MTVTNKLGQIAKVQRTINRHRTRKFNERPDAVKCSSSFTSEPKQIRLAKETFNSIESDKASLNPRRNSKRLSGGDYNDSPIPSSRETTESKILLPNNNVQVDNNNIPPTNTSDGFPSNDAPNQNESSDGVSDNEQNISAYEDLERTLGQTGQDSGELKEPTDFTITVLPTNDSDGATRSTRTSNRKCSYTELIIGGIGTLTIIVFVLVYAIFPAIFYWSADIRRRIVFRTFTGVSTGFADPESLGMNCSRNYYISSDEGIRLGTWYVQSNAIPCPPNRAMFPGDITTALYIHGVAGDRQSQPRVRLVQTLSKDAKLHTVTFDFRGFGDSTDVTPSLDYVVSDTMAVYESIRAVVPATRIVLWGHSLGASVALYLVAKLVERNATPSALVLESAFDNIGTVSKATPYSWLWRWMPCFDTLVPNQIMSDPATSFNSTEAAKKLVHSLPILMLHAEDDEIVPIERGLVLHRAIVSNRQTDLDSAPVVFITFKASHGYGHSSIASYPRLSQIIGRFLNSPENLPPFGPTLMYHV